MGSEPIGSSLDLVSSDDGGILMLDAPVDLAAQLAAAATELRGRAERADAFLATIGKMTLSIGIDSYTELRDHYQAAVDLIDGTLALHAPTKPSSRCGCGNCADLPIGCATCRTIWGEWEPSPCPTLRLLVPLVRAFLPDCGVT